MEIELQESERPGVACALCGERHGVTGLPCRMRHAVTPGYLEFPSRIWEGAPEWATAVGRIFRRTVWASDTHYKYPDDPVVYDIDDQVRQHLIIAERR